MTTSNDPRDMAAEYLERPGTTPGVRRTEDQDIGDKARDAAEEVGRRAEEAGRQAATRVDDAMTITGERLSDVARTLRERAPTGQTGEVAENAARALERGGDYLRRSDVQSVRHDLETVVREHPLEALAIGIGVGFLLARGMRSRRSYYG